jgi:hypothetical protein
MPYQPDLQLPATTPGGMATGVDGQRLGATSEAAAKANLASSKKAEEDQAKKFSGTPLPIPIKGKSNHKILRYPAKPAIDESQDYVLFDFYQYEPPFRNRGAQAYTGKTAVETYNASNYNESDLKTQIILYMPEDISTGHKANWQGKNFSNIGAGLLAQAGAPNATDNLKSLAANLDQSFSNVIPIAGAQAVTAILGKITGESVSLDEFIGSTRGVILNPNSELLFSGLDMRNFSLNYKLVPRNKSELDQVEAIVRTFKKAMLPYGNSGYSDPGGTAVPDILTFGINPTAGDSSISASYIKVPDVCRVSFMRGMGLNPNVPQYKVCAITGVDISYTPDGTYAITKDGGMVAYQLSLSFQETKLVFREDIRDTGASY